MLTPRSREARTTWLARGRRVRSYSASAADRIVRLRRERRGEHAAILDRLARALPQVRQHRVRGVAEHGDPTLRPLRDRVPVVERPLVPDVSRRKDPQQRLVPAAVALEHLLRSHSGDPGLVPVALVVVVADDVDQLVSPHGIKHDRAVRPQPLDVVVRRRFTGHGIDRDHAAVADLAGEARRIRAEQRRSHDRVDPVGADDHVGLDLAAVLESRDRDVAVRLDSDAARAERDDVARQRLRQHVEQVGAMGGRARAAEQARPAAAGSSSRSTRPVFPLRVTAHSERPAIARTSSSRPSERSTFIAFGPRATPAPISRNSGAAS